MIVQVMLCPAPMLLVASDEPGAVCTQLPIKIGVKPANGVSCIVNLPGPKKTS
ncbi:MAG TPA: hypothetical protein VE619_11925 [Nitrososphaeraceae archaeon]|nr:hypothetical protein [Nitrososphaeraceae archaeon]